MKITRLEKKKKNSVFCDFCTIARRKKWESFRNISFLVLCLHFKNILITHWKGVSLGVSLSRQWLAEKSVTFHHAHLHRRVAIPKNDDKKDKKAKRGETLVERTMVLITWERKGKAEKKENKNHWFCPLAHH